MSGTANVGIPETDLDTSGLSEQERDALAASQNEAQELEALIASEEEAAGEETTETAPDAAATEKKPAEAAQAEQPKTEAAAEAAETPADEEEEEPFVPRMTDAAFDPTKANERLGTIESERRDLTQKFKDGELTFDQYSEARDKLDDERGTLKMNMRDFENDQKAQQQINTVKMQRWTNTVSTFQKSHPEYALQDHPTLKDEAGNALRVPVNPVMYSALDGTVKMLANDPANATKSNAWFLSEAHRLVQVQFAGVSRAAPKTPAKPDPVKEATAKRKPNLAVVPKTVAEMPAADVSETGGPTDEFAHLDQLSGMDLEVAIAAMTPAQQARYASKGYNY